MHCRNRPSGPAAFGQNQQPLQQFLQPRNLVVNGDFSADGGSLDGWTTNQNVDNYYWQMHVNGTSDYAANGCYGAVCITGTDAQKNYLYQAIHTIPGLRYQLTFTYDAGSSGVNE